MEQSMNASRLPFAAVMVAAASFAWTQQYQYRFQNPSVPIEARINNILFLMTPEEKITRLARPPMCRASEFAVAATLRACMASLSATMAVGKVAA